MLLIYLPFRNQRLLFNTYLNRHIPTLGCRSVMFDYRACPKTVYCNKSIDMIPEGEGYRPYCKKCRVLIDIQDWNERHIFGVQEPEKNILVISESFRFTNYKDQDLDLKSDHKPCLSVKNLEQLISHVDLAIYLDGDKMFDRTLGSWEVDLEHVADFVNSEKGLRLLSTQNIDASKKIVRSYLEYEKAKSYGCPI